MSKEISLVDKVASEISLELKNPKAMGMLLATTFKGLNETSAKQALFEGMVRGFSFKDFVEKNVYAIGYGDTYSLVTSIDHVRKIAMQNGLAGKDAPCFEVSDDGKKVISCTVTVKRSANGIVGEYTDTVYFDEYYAGHKNADGTIKKTKYGDMKPGLWDTKPRTMIAKVAEMHALRQAFPDQLSKYYTEEEMNKEVAAQQVVATPIVIDSSKAIAKLKAAKTGEELSKVWANLSADERRIEDVLFTYNEEVRSHDNS